VSVGRPLGCEITTDVQYVNADPRPGPGGAVAQFQDVDRVSCLPTNVELAG
jgi:hypothetical protein